MFTIFKWICISFTIDILNITSYSTPCFYKTLKMLFFILTCQTIKTFQSRMVICLRHFAIRYSAIIFIIFLA